MDIKKRIQELSLDQKAKLYFMGLVRQGKIDTLPEDPKAAYVSMMMDKDDYGRSISGKDKRTFMEPEDSMPAARARKLAGMEDDEMETRYDYDDPVFENYTKQSLLKALGNADDALIQTHISPGEKGEGDYRLDGQEYVIYNPNSNNKDNAAMWNSDDYVVALDKDGEEYEIAYSDIMRINLEETRDEEDEENDRNLALDDIYEKTNEFIDNSYILDTNMNSILFKLNRVYKIHEFDDLLSNKLKSSKYKFSSIDFVKSNFENTYRLYFSNQDYSSNFVNILGKLIDIDVIELYAKDNMNKIRRIGIAHIPDINTSLLCNKFISKNELSNLRCKFNFKFKKWVPLKVINEKYFECAKYEDINNYMCNIIGN